ncbi:MAG TPA: PKD domain-containing protein [Aquabacterium sp.]|uniref:PKD domain-containing protein n=1 Tax=Aquabacterium sp. TaxID=1872578 RepID=UPI002E2F3932|nr:PKD domain-containing protein [Aquabacterium sp.]HEX5371914.1 PKD domain-containing protein [Aquabacterium sp.]
MAIKLTWRWLLAIVAACLLSACEPAADIVAPTQATVGTDITFDSKLLPQFTPESLVNAQYDWDFGDGSHGTGPQVHHTYAQAGEYRVVLRISDDTTRQWGQAYETVATVTVTDVATAECAITRSQPGSAPVVSASHPKVFLNHAQTLNCLRSMASAEHASFTRFKAFVDREIADGVDTDSMYGYEDWFAALLYRVTGETKYRDFAIARADKFVASEEALIASGQRATVAHDSYLYVGPIVGNLALVYDWCHDTLTPAQRTRWTAYMNQSVHNVWHPETASWGGKVFPWSGWSIDNPSNNYYYSFLRATMLTGLATHGENSRAQEWLDVFRNDKIGQELVPTFTQDLAGGGSREGTGYGTAMKNLFQIYDWWERSTGERIATLTPHAQASQAWMMHNILPTLDHLAAVGDQARESTASLFDYHREYLLSLISLFPQDRMSSAAKSLLDQSTVPQMQYGFELFADYLYHPPALAAGSLSDLSTSYWSPGTGEVMMRSSWTDRNATYAHFSCGPYTESHAHRDQGSFQIYRGEWLAPTNNIYTHSGIQQGEALNNLVRITQGGNTLAQGWGQRCDLAALADTPLYTYVAARVTPMYTGQAAVTQVEREYLFIKPDTFVVLDRAGSASGTQRVWTLNLPGAPSVQGDQLSYTGALGNRLDVHRVAPRGLSYQVTDPMTEFDESWSQSAKQVNVADGSGAQTIFLHVLGTNGSVKLTSSADVSGQTGVRIDLADGRIAIVRFDNNAPGGSLILTNADGTTVSSGPLPTSVQAPALFRQ